MYPLSDQNCTRLTFFLVVCNVCVGFGRASIDIARGTAEENRVYCSKGGDVFEWGSAASVGRGVRGGAGTKRVWEEALRLAQSGKFDEVDPRIQLLYHDKLEAARKRFQKEQVAAKLVCPQIQLKPWQVYLDRELDGPPRDRVIYHVHDRAGNAGKTTFATWLARKHGSKLVRLTTTGRYGLEHIVEYGAGIYILDCARESRGHINWAFFEDIKNGYVIDTKYEGGVYEFPTPHVVILCNWPLYDASDDSKHPDDRRPYFSVDRVIEIDPHRSEVSECGAQWKAL